MHACNTLQSSCTHVHERMRIHVQVASCLHEYTLDTRSSHHQERRTASASAGLQRTPCSLTCRSTLPRNTKPTSVLRTKSPVRTKRSVGACGSCARLCPSCTGPGPRIAPPASISPNFDAEVSGEPVYPLATCNPTITSSPVSHACDPGEGRGQRPGSGKGSNCARTGSCCGSGCGT